MASTLHADPHHIANNSGAGIYGAVQNSAQALQQYFPEGGNIEPPASDPISTTAAARLNTYNPTVINRVQSQNTVLHTIAHRLGATAQNLTTADDENAQALGGGSGSIVSNPVPAEGYYPQRPVPNLSTTTSMTTVDPLTYAQQLQAGPGASTARQQATNLRAYANGPHTEVRQAVTDAANSLPTTWTTGGTETAGPLLQQRGEKHDELGSTLNSLAGMHDTLASAYQTVVANHPTPEEITTARQNVVTASKSRSPAAMSEATANLQAVNNQSADAISSYQQAVNAGIPSSLGSWDDSSGLGSGLGSLSGGSGGRHHHGSGSGSSSQSTSTGSSSSSTGSGSSAGSSSTGTGTTSSATTSTGTAGTESTSGTSAADSADSANSADSSEDPMEAMMMAQEMMSMGQQGAQAAQQAQASKQGDDLAKQLKDQEKNAVGTDNNIPPIVDPGGGGGGGDEYVDDGGGGGADAGGSPIQPAAAATGTVLPRTPVIEPSNGAPENSAAAANANRAGGYAPYGAPMGAGRGMGGKERDRVVAWHPDRLMYVDDTPHTEAVIGEQPSIAPTVTPATPANTPTPQSGGAV